MFMYDFLCILWPILCANMNKHVRVWDAINNIGELPLALSQLLYILVIAMHEHHSYLK